MPMSVHVSGEQTVCQHLWHTSQAAVCMQVYTAEAIWHVEQLRADAAEAETARTKKDLGAQLDKVK